jgi:protein-tyrosine phosphatase
VIDIHTHILPGLDDGAKTVEDSLRMIRQAIDVGVEVICATPHVLDGVTASFQEKIGRTFQLLCSQVEKEKLKIRLVLGSEIYIRQDVHFLARFNFFSLNQTGKYVLLELPLGHVPPNLDRLVHNLLLNGVTPIIAHPERSIVGKSQLKPVEDLVRLGSLTQINAGSLLGQFGKVPRRAAECLLSRDLVHLMASDAHDADARSIAILRQAFAGVCQLVGRTRAEKLVMSNPSRILSGEDLATDRCGAAAEKRIVQLKVAEDHDCN